MCILIFFLLQGEEHWFGQPPDLTYIRTRGLFLIFLIFLFFLPSFYFCLRQLWFCSTTAHLFLFKNCFPTYFPYVIHFPMSFDVFILFWCRCFCFCFHVFVRRPRSLRAAVDEYLSRVTRESRGKAGKERAEIERAQEDADRLKRCPISMALLLSLLLNTQYYSFKYLLIAFGGISVSSVCSPPPYHVRVRLQAKKPSISIYKSLCW